MDFGFAVAVFGHGQTFPLHASVEDPQNQIEEVMVAEFAPGPTPGHGEVGQDKWVELRFRQLHRNRRGNGLLGWRGHDEMALFEEGSVGLCETLSSNRIIY